jgi:hypothetical protein
MAATVFAENHSSAMARCAINQRKPHAATLNAFPGKEIQILQAQRADEAHSTFYHADP